MGMCSLSLLESRLRRGGSPADSDPWPDVCIDSRKVTPGAVFVALPPVGGEHAAGGAAFIQDALARGAGYIVCVPEQAVSCPSDQVEVVDCADPRKALGQLLRARHGTERLSFPLVGVTGTNGKTTCTYLLEHLFGSAGWKTGVLGTVAYRWPGHVEDAAMTTPDCPDLHAMLAAMQESGVGIAFMEVSSHALDQERVAGLDFRGAVFTNLTQDHLDYHGDMGRYFHAKARLFRELCSASAVRVVGADNEWGRNLLELVPEAWGYGLQEQPAGAAYLAGEMISSGTDGLWLRMRYAGKTWKLHSPLVGRFNAENLLAVQALGLGFGLTPEDFQCLETFNGVPGRLERIPNPANHAVFVDYAHTPDALVNVLTALRGAGFPRIITVFGCGGDRDRTKRPRMGEAVARFSDVAVLTSDNPRHEAPEAIMADVMPGLAGAKQVLQEPDRGLAIQKALELMQAGDVLLVAGKGHERTQQIGDVKYPFSDQQIIREMLGCA